MNKTIKIMAALLPLFFTSCNNDDANVTTVPQQEQTVTISAGITRAEGQTTEGFSYDIIKVTNVTRQGKGLPSSQAVFTLDTSGTTATWTMSEGTLLWCAGMENTFQAVYPATADYSSFTVPTDQSTEEKLNSADWMTGEAKATLNNLTNASPLNINLTRKMAMVVVEVSTTGSIGYEFYFITNGNNLITPNKNNSTYQAILPVGDYSSGSKAVVSIKENSTQNEKKYFLPSNITSFEAGKKYTFNLTIDANSSSGGASTRSAASDNLTLVSVDPM